MHPGSRYSVSEFLGYADSAAPRGSRACARQTWLWPALLSPSAGSRSTLETSLCFSNDRNGLGALISAVVRCCW